MPRLEPSDEEEQHEGGVGGVKSKKKKKRNESTRDINREARRRGGEGRGGATCAAEVEAAESCSAWGWGGVGPPRCRLLPWLRVQSWQRGGASWAR